MTCRPKTPKTEPEFNVLPPTVDITPLPDQVLADLPEPDPAPDEQAPKPSRVAQVNVGRSPYGMGLSPSGAYLFVANHQDGSMTILSTSDHSSVASVPLGGETSPYAIAVSPSGNRLFVSTFNGSSVVALEAVRFTPVGSAALGSFTEGVAVTPDGKTLLVCEPLANRLHLLDTDPLQPRREVPVGKEPHGVVVSPDGRAAYVTLGGVNGVAVLELPSGRVLGKPILVGDAPRGIAISPSGDLLAVADVGSHTLTLVSTIRGEAVARVRVGRQPVGVCFSPSGRFVYVANFGSRSVMAVSVALAQQAVNQDTANAVRARVKLPGHPWSVLMTGDGKLCYVTGQDRNAVDVLATNGMQ